MSQIQISDVDVLRNAVRFSTSQRAYAANAVMDKAQQGLSSDETAYLCVEGLTCFVTATEDLLGWAQALRKWYPPNPRQQLFSLLDGVEVTSSQEDAILTFFRKANPDRMRGLLRIPVDQELLESGIDPEFIPRLTKALPHLLDGWTRLTELRVEKDRALVTAFNKIKHNLLVFPDAGLTELRLATIQEPNGLGGLRIPVEQDYAYGRARQALESQAVLNSTLRYILAAQGLSEPTPEWVIKALDTWVDP